MKGAPLEILLFLFILPALLLLPDLLRPTLSITRHSPLLDKIIPRDAHVEILASGFVWLEGPLWTETGLLFSDTVLNSIFLWRESSGVTVALNGIYKGPERWKKVEPGSNGLAYLAKEKTLVMCEHGNRWISAVNISDVFSERSYRENAWNWRGNRKVLASKNGPMKLNSPNDLVVSSKGSIYFTDPIYGLQDHQFNEGKGNLDQHPLRELTYSGVYVLKNPLDPETREMILLDNSLSRPNGIGLSPDEKLLYVSNSKEGSTFLNVYDIEEETETTRGGGRQFFDGNVLKGPGWMDGFVVDKKGNILTSGPGGISIISPDGELLGKIETGRPTSNCEIGKDGYLYITAQSLLLRVPLVGS